MRQYQWLKELFELDRIPEKEYVKQLNEIFLQNEIENQKITKLLERVKQIKGKINENKT